MVRTAFFPDSFLEVNGVAHTSRQLVDYARRRNLPFLCVHAGPETMNETGGNLRRVQLKRSPASFGLDRDLIFDLLYLRHLDHVIAECRRFAPDVVHITGPNDNGILGALVAHCLKTPLVASWHTNLHEYSGRRAAGMLPFLPAVWREQLANQAERHSLAACVRYYRLGRVLFAPNPELCRLLERRCQRPCLPMPRGVDTELFSPAHRQRTDNAVRIGYVGRLTVEKNIRFLADIEQMMLARGIGNFQFYIVGQGSDDAWLRENMRHAKLAGVLHGDDLSRAYANMDIFAFPSRTDTFGNVVLEALASGVPAVVTNGGGPKFIVRDGETGFVTATSFSFAQAVAQLTVDKEMRSRMGAAARVHAFSASWDSVFDRVYNGYQSAIPRLPAVHGQVVLRPAS
ncbi:MAG TPA: glycosyltransferase [Verrucomicrobiae bacterium]|jgi:phosphatidylinositol alpha 1,6-mannosyltransferase|nr:glycosyltransferase [Verrucomicrobiae bacterium]